MTSGLPSSPDATVRRPEWGLALAFVGFGLLVLFLGWPIKSFNFGTTGEPGPRFLPLLMAASLIVGGIVLTCFPPAVESLSTREGEDGNASVEAGGEPGHRLALLGGSFLAYLALMPILGFYAASGAFGLLMMRLQGLSWRLSVGTLAALLTVIHLAFERGFKVMLP